jgi:hypothetical protein
MTNNDVDELSENLRQAKTLLISVWQSLRRHKVALAISGALALRGHSQEQAECLLRAICSAAGDEELKDRLDAVASTFKRLREGKTVMEIGVLWNEGLLDDEIIKRLSELLSK